MKNIHLLPTDKPSRLGYLTKKGKEIFKDLRLFDKPMPNILDSENQHIYITSDEEIKEGDWVVKISSLYKGGGNVQKYSFIDSQFEDITFKKIILTTDQDLIADGVQAIDDEFLKWFVNNPSCEFLKTYWNPLNNEYDYLQPQEESKQETLEEAAEKWVFETNGHKWSNNDNTAGDNYGSFKAGANWRAEKMYSEEEVRELLLMQRGNSYVAILTKTKDKELAAIASTAPEPGGKDGWVKQFKKK
jgi:hypothetical protein